MTTHPKLALRSISATPVNVPMKRKLGTSAQSIESAPLLLVDLQIRAGRQRTTSYAVLLSSVGRQVPGARRRRPERCPFGARVVAPRRRRTGGALFQATRTVGSPHDGSLRRSTGPCGDALATAEGVPLATYLGGTTDPIRAYDSNGLGIMSPEAAADEAEELLVGGFRGMKLRLREAQSRGRSGDGQGRSPTGCRTKSP